MGGWKLVGCPTRERQIRWPLQGAERQRRGQPAAVWVGEWQAALGVWVQNSVVVVHAPIHGRRKELLRPIIDVDRMICETVSLDDLRNRFDGVGCTVAGSTVHTPGVTTQVNSYEVRIVR